MLPAIYFIFSRAACSDAVTQCLREGLRLTTPEERRQVRAIVEQKVASLSDDDLRVLDYPAFINGMEAGIAAHHAGMVPPFKEAVEACFASALVKVVFATETLALGINMPARTVVIEKLTKFTGERHEFLTPGEYTQLTGRAGRRGIDEVGHAVVLWSPFVPFDQVAGLAGTRTYALTSSFRPTYNMAVNLVRRYAPDVAHHLLNLSFAQYRADVEVVRLEAQLERTAHLLAEARTAASCERGSVDEYRQILALAGATRRREAVPEAEVKASLGELKPGDVVVVPGGKSGGRVAVLSTSRRRGGDVRVRAITPERRVLSLGPRDFPEPPRPVGRVDLPTPYAPNSHGFQRQVASALVAARIRADRATLSRRAGPATASQAVTPDHPVTGCPDLSLHLRAAERAERFARDIDRQEGRIRSRTESLARQFDRVLRVLEAWGYVEGWALTERGDWLARIYHESDLLVAECLAQGLLDDLTGPEVAGLVSTFTYEQRGPGEEPATWFPTGALHERWMAIDRVARELAAAEEDAGLPMTRPPQPGFVPLAWAWASGRDLTEILGDDEVSGGDFVRNVKQLIDLLRQLGDAAPNAGTATAARQAAEALYRGIVAASSVVATGPTGPTGPTEPTGLTGPTGPTGDDGDDD